MLKPFVRSALFILFTIAATFSSSSAIAETDFNTTHVYSTEEVNKQSIIDGLRLSLNNTGEFVTCAPDDLDCNDLFARWNEEFPVGTPVTIRYAFYPDIGFTYRAFYEREKVLIISLLDAISSVSGITFIEDDPADRTERYHLMFMNRADEVSVSDYFGLHSCATNLSDCELQSVFIRLSVTGLLDYLDPQREFDSSSWNIDYKHDLSKAKSELLYHILKSLGLYSTDNAYVKAKLAPENDNKFYTVMSPNVGQVSSEVFYPTDLKKYDVAVLQHLYGKATDTNVGDTMYSFDDTYDFHQLIYDVDGIDTLSLADTTRNNIIDLRAGAFSSIAPNPTGFYDSNVGGEHLNRSHNNLSIAYDVVIENAVGGKGDDILVANSVANMLDGGDGIDTAKFSGNKADYTIETINAYTVEVTSVVDAENKDSLVDFEFIQFADETIAINKPPVVTMPETVTVREGLQVNIAVTVTQPDDDVHTYMWTQIDGTEVTLENSDALNVNFVAPAVDAQETINLQLEVSDGTNVVTSSVEVVVIPNNAPVITDVTAEQTVDEGDTVSLTVTATDADSDTLTYRWVVNGATVTLTGDTTDTITFTSPDVTSDTALTVEVFVTDSFDEVSTTSTVTVQNVETPTTPTTPEVTPEKGKSSGGSFGYFILLFAGLRLLRR